MRIQLQQLETTLTSQCQNFELSIAKQRASHEFLLETYELEKKTAEVKAEIYASNQVKYRQARSSIRNLLDAEIQKLSAKLTLLKIENELIKQMLDYQYETRNGDILNR